MQRFEIVAVPGSGKTQLAQRCEELGVCALYEDYRANPYWRDACMGRLRSWYKTDITFLRQHVQQISALEERDQPFICDFSLIADRVFAESRLSLDELISYRRLYEERVSSVSPPASYIVLDIPTPKILENVKRRGRVEEQGMTGAHLDNLRLLLTDAIAREHFQSRTNVIRLDEAMLEDAAPAIVNAMTRSC
jgi:deoxyadenosine/deoxycytidine kinase